MTVCSKNFFVPFLALALFFLLGGCSAAPDPVTKAEVPKDPFAEGVLKAVAHFAPQNSPTQMLSRIAEQEGWESEVARNTLLRVAVTEGHFSQKVEPYMLALFFNKGFSVLPTVGEGHQFARDSIVRGGVANSTFLVTTRERVRIIFLTPLQNVQIIFPQDGIQPQLFTPSPGGVVAVRRSLLEHYLR